LHLNQPEQAVGLCMDSNRWTWSRRQNTRVQTLSRSEQSPIVLDQAAKTGE
jgi:hypothetical protein